MSRIFAYCRVSTDEQTTENQKQEIRQAGYEIEPFRFVEEWISGSIAARNRPEFAKLLDRLEPNDALVITKIDRLGRSALDVLSVIELLSSSKIKLFCTSMGNTDLTSSTGKMAMQMLAAVAEFERNLIVERTHAGINRARAQGKRIGRPPALTGAQRHIVIKRLKANATIYQLAKEYGVARRTIMRIRDQIKES